MMGERTPLAEQLTVLVIDDEPPLRDLVRDYLAREGFRVVTAADGLTAVEMARAHQPDIVVLDLMLPGIDGLEVCRRLRTFSDAYVIMLTARAEEVDRVVGLEVGADDYLTKPFSPRELVARVRAMLRRPRQGNLAEQVESDAPQRFGDLVADAPPALLSGRRRCRPADPIPGHPRPRPDPVRPRDGRHDGVWHDGWRDGWDDAPDVS